MISKIFSISITFIIFTLFFQQVYSYKKTKPIQPSIFQRQQALKNNQQTLRKQIEMSYHNYHLYPFAIVSDPQQFILAFQQKQQVKGEISVLWIDSKTNDVKLPEYNLQEYISIKVVDQQNNIVIPQRKFHYESGIQFLALPNKKYRIIFTNSGLQGKMIQFVLSYVEPSQLTTMTNTSNIIQQASIKTQYLLEQVQNIFRKTQQSLMIGGKVHENINYNVKKYYAGCIWEIVFVIMLVIGQIYMFGNFLENNYSLI